MRDINKKETSFSTSTTTNIEKGIDKRSAGGGGGCSASADSSSSSGWFCSQNDEQGSSKSIERQQQQQQPQHRKARRRRTRCLDFKKVQHCGRTLQLDLLNKQFELAKQGHSSTIIIEGASGCGKTALVQTFVEKTCVVMSKNGRTSSLSSSDSSKEEEDVDTTDPTSTRNNSKRMQEEGSSSWPLLIGKCKFEERMASSEPFKAISELVEGIVEDILAREEATTWMERITDAVGDDLFMLLEIVPTLAKLLVRSNNIKGDRDSRLQHQRRQSSSSSLYEIVNYRRHKQALSTTASDDHSGRGGERPASSNNMSSHFSSSSSSSLNIFDLDTKAFGNMSKKEWRFERFRIAFREFIRCLSKHSTLVIMLDDLHYAEQDSFALIETLMEDISRTNASSKKKSKLLLICATRPHPQHEYHVAESDHLFRIQLEELSPTQICHLLEILLEKENDTTATAITTRSPSESPSNQQNLQNLADAIYDKTLGNAFVVTHFIRQLEISGFIYYVDDADNDDKLPMIGVEGDDGSTTTMGCYAGCWMFDLEQILQKMEGCSETVEEVIVTRLKSLDKNQRQLLVTAASFGVSYFELSVIVHAIKAMEDDGDEDDVANEDIRYSSPFQVRASMTDIGSLLDVSIQNGFVEQVSPGIFKFSHDRIRDAAYSLLPTGDAKKRLHLKIGRQLRRWMDTEAEYGTTLSDDSLTMHAAKHLSHGADMVFDKWERIDIAELNLSAAEIAAKKAAFFPSMDYLENGIRVLGPTAWVDHFELCLKLHVAMTRIQFSCGLLDGCNETAERVIANAKSFDQKKDVYHQMLLCLLQQERATEGVDLAMSILRGLGHKVPKRFLALYVIRRYIKVESFLKKITDDEIRQIPSFSDPKIDDQISILFQLPLFAFYGAPSIYYSLSAVDILNTLIDRGNHPLTTPMGLVTWAAVQIVEGKFKESERFADLAIEMADRLCDQHPAVKARIMCLVSFFVYSWCGPPVHDLVDTLLANFRLVLRFGAMEVYHTDGVNAPRFLFFCGRPLNDVAAQCRKYMDVLHDYKRTFLWNLCAPLAQALSNFSTPTSNDPTILCGEILDPSVLAAIETSKVDAGRFQYQLYSMILAYHFGKPEKAASFEKLLRKDLWADSSEPPSVSTRVFYAGLVYVSLYRQKKGRRNRLKAIAAVKLFNKWVTNGATNCEYMELILDAELSTIQSKRQMGDVLLKFEKAIQAAAEMEILHHEALANELACDYLIHRSCENDKNKAQLFLQRSLDCYERWGGLAKVQEMKRRHKDLLDLA